MSPLGSIMASAGVARRQDAARLAVAPTVLLPRISTDPLDELVDRVRPTLGNAVDALQVAAALESDGMTDRAARVEYGYSDVFALAADVFRRLGPALPAAADARMPIRRRRDDLRVLSHGPLYVLPSAVFPAAMVVAGRQSLVLALVCASGLGWMYAGVAGHAAYLLRGTDRPAGAARVLRLATLFAPVLGALLGVPLVMLTGGGPALAAFVVGLLTYQMAAAVLVFYRREPRLVVAMAPAVLAGAGFLADPDWLGVAVGTAVAGVVVTLALALHATRGHRDAHPVLAGQWPVLTGVAAYGICSAAVLLHAEAPYLLGRLDIAVAVAPLILAMGFVEWRAELFRPRAVALTRRVRRPEQFVRRVRLRLAGEMLGCVAAAAVPALALLAGLAWTGRLSAAGVWMTAAHVALAGAYFLAFQLAGAGRYGWLCGSMLLALAAHVGLGVLLDAAPLLGRTADPATDTALYLGSVLLLQALFLLGLMPHVGQVRRYR